MTVSLTRAAEKDLKGLSPAARTRALKALGRLHDDPMAGHPLSGSLRRSLEFSAPEGAYRAAYIIDEQTCVVFLIGPHEDFYKLAERRARTRR